jgi:hypothetical protein
VKNILDAGAGGLLRLKPLELVAPPIPFLVVMNNQQLTFIRPAVDVGKRHTMVVGGSANDREYVGEMLSDCIRFLEVGVIVSG